MSVNEIQALTQKFADAFDQRDLQPVMEFIVRSRANRRGAGSRTEGA
jgi:hypothetical protein